MRLKTAIDELCALYHADDEHTPYLLTERRADGLDVICKDGSTLSITVTVSKLPKEEGAQ